MRYRLIYSKHGQQLTCWSDDYSWILVRYYRFHKCGYNEQGSRLLERSLYNG